MARQLTRRMFGHEFNPKSREFGLCCGQIRGGDGLIIRNSGWYNKLGEKLGFGDLTVENFQRISNELEDGEQFIILNEFDSYLKLATRSVKAIVTEPTMEAPGVDYVAKHAIYIIVRNQLYCVDRYGSLGEEFLDRGLRFKILKQAAVKTLMTAGVLT